MRYLFDSSKLLVQGLAIWLVWPSLRSYLRNYFINQMGSGYCHLSRDAAQVNFVSIRIGRVSR